MRKKATIQDIFYIEQHTDMSPEELSVALDLSIETVKKHILPPPKKNKLGRSKIVLNNGQTVYQMTTDIDHQPPQRKLENLDVKNGIFRPE